ncbi:MAG: hypothetical protein EBR54_04315 [Flavobacteriia bacterium]|nr:hypothetical protein [Flavobacteriia bacterium]
MFINSIIGIQPYLNRPQPDGEDISITLKSSYFLVFIDLLAKLFILLLGIVLFKVSFREPAVGKYTYTLFIWFLNFLVLSVTVYYALRRLKGIQVYLKYRILAFPSYLQKQPSKRPEQHKLFVYSSSNENKLAIAFLYALINTLITSPLLFLYPVNINFPLILSLVTFLVSFFMAWRYSCIFIERKILKASFLKKELNQEQLEALEEGYLNKEVFVQDTSLEFWNDKFIIRLEKDFNIYKEKLDTFLLESVFLGALTFTTYIQLISNNDNWTEFTTTLSSFLSNDSIKIWQDHSLRQNIGFSLLLAGSVISSLFYMVILLKRFPIIKSIETVRWLLNLAKYYNTKEESEQNNYPKEDYSKQIQFEIARCEEQKIILDSNFRIISMLRMAGLLSFFFVLLVATLMIDIYFFAFSACLLLYVIVAAKLMEENKLMKFIMDNRSKNKTKKNARKFTS